MNKKYNSFIQLKINPMAQSISDMTYLYKETEVPSSHYKKLLDEVIEDDINEIVNYEMLNIYVKQIKHLIDENPILFLKALLCIEKKIKLLDIRPKEQISLNNVVSYYQENIKNAKLLNQQLLDIYDNKNDDIKEIDFENIDKTLN